MVSGKDVCFPQTFYYLYNERIMQNLEGYSKIKVGGQNINNLRSAGDTVFIAESKEDLQQLLDIKLETTQMCFFSENAMNFIDCKEIKGNNITRSRHNKMTDK